MHGRLKVRSTAEQEEAKRIEREKKLKFYKKIVSDCLKKIELNDLDENGLKLTEDILCANPDVLTLWNLRRRILLNLDKPETGKTEDELDAIYKTELNISEIALRRNPKSYGSWLHRQWCLIHSRELNLKSTAANWKNELQLCNKYLELDERNFHCWAHRQFIVNENKDISKLDEFKYTFDKISTNFSNYSSWHYRSKLIKDLYLNPDENNKLKIAENFFQTEITLIENAVFTDPNDQSAWIYHRWLFNEYLHNNIIKSIKLKPNESSIELQLPRKDFNLTSLKVNQQKLGDSTTWTNSSVDNSLWNGSFNETIDTNSNQLKIEFTFKGIGDLHYILHKTPNGDYEYESLFILNADDKLFQAHLNNLLELSSLENNKNKWCLVTLVYLMSLIDYKKHESSINEHLNLLINEVDCNRKQYYSDWKQKLYLQNL